MQYCPTCQTLLPPGEDECPQCGGEARTIRGTDPVLLLRVGAMQADMIAPLLDAQDIPYSRVGEMGVGFTMRAGAFLESYRFFVPYGAYRRAHDTIAQTFGEDPEIIRALR